MTLRLGVDVGGTFTDFVVVSDTGEMRNLKVASTPANPAEAIFAGLEQLVPPGQRGGVVHFSQGTTVGVNTLVQRDGARLAVLVTRGFRDIFEIGRLRLPDPTNLFFQKLKPLVGRDLVFEVAERLDAAGGVLEALDLAALDATIDRLRELRVEAVAVCFMHAYRNDAHEAAAIARLRERLPGVYICGSAETWPEQKEYERALVAAINSYIGPRMDQYYSFIAQRAGELGLTCEPLSTRSNGGVMSARAARQNPVATLLSGPASGVIGASYIGRLAGYPGMITFDMGGTTAEVALIDGEVSYSTESTIGDFPLVVPAVDVSSIGAGGGSVAWVDEFGVLKVGPRSAGARPGPACYNRGGTEPTVTDAYLMIGLLKPDAFAGGLELRADLAEAALTRLGASLGMNAHQAAEAILEVATANMYAQLILLMSRKGVDHREFPLIACGGAGPSHALLLAREAGIRTVIIPPSPGTLCALGALIADIRTDLIETFYCETTAISPERIGAAFARLEAEGLAWLKEQRVPIAAHRTVLSADVRYKGQAFHLTVTLPQAVPGQPVGVGQIHESFHDQYLKTYGYSDRSALIELINIRVSVVGELPELNMAGAGAGAKADPLIEHRRMHVGGRPIDVPVYDKNALQASFVAAGPAILSSFDTTVFVPEGYRAQARDHGIVIVEAV